MRAFTLIELLVVITIIVVLLALLTPALDRAIYQAELAVCGTNLKTIATGAMIYASEHKRKWIWRQEISENGNKKPNVISRRNEDGVFKGDDDLPRFLPYFNFNAVFSCPLSTDVDWVGSRPDSTLEVDYFIWFGWQWTFPTENKGMYKIGDRFAWTDPDVQGAPKTYRWNLLASDYDHSFDDGGSHHGHQDKDGVAVEEAIQDEQGFVSNATLSRWVAETPRGPVDTNVVHDDGSVDRYVDETWLEVGVNPMPDASRFVATPVTNDGTLWPNLWINIPKP